MRTIPAHARSRTFVLSLLAVAAAFGCRHTAAASGLTATATVRRGTVEDVYILTGEVQAVRSRELTAPRAEGGRFQIRWMAEDGTEVEEGQTVLELDNAQVAQSLEEKRLRLAQARIALEGRESGLEAEGAQKRLEFDKAQVVAEKAAIEAAVPQELRSRKEWHEKQQALRTAEAALEKARLGLTTLETTGRAELEGLRIAQEKAERAVHVAEASLGELSVRAPRPGIVLVGRSPFEDRPIQAGDNVFPGFRLASIPEPGSMEIVAYLPEVDEGRVAPGQPARVVLDTYPGQPMQGRVAEVSAVAQDVRYTSGFKVRIGLSAPDSRLLVPGLSARVEVTRRTLENALLVPRRAVFRDGGHARVRRVGYTPIEVEITSCLTLECVVTGGLTEGDRVLLR